MATTRRTLRRNPPTPGEAISAVFFLDSSTGWVLFAGGGSDEDQSRFGFLNSFTSFLLAARTEATRMFCTMQS